MRRTEDGTFQLITAIVIAAVLALLLWNLAIRPAGAASDARTCYIYPVTLRHVHCTLIGWCSAYEDVHINGRSTLPVYITGWNLKNGQVKLVRICR